MHLTTKAYLSIPLVSKGKIKGVECTLGYRRVHASNGLSDKDNVDISISW